MDIQKTKLEIIKQILEIDNLNELEQISNVLKKENKDFWKELTPSQKQEIDKADVQRVNEETFDYETFISPHRNRKLNFIRDFINLENEETISKLENLLWQNNDFWNELSLSEKEEIEQGIKELNEGKRYSYESVLKEIS
jgi:TRAP-type C4-dicarboxylate transport system substrate-binding protein